MSLVYRKKEYPFKKGRKGRRDGGGGERKTRKQRNEFYLWVWFHHGMAN